MEISKDTNQNKQLSLEYQDKSDSNLICEKNNSLDFHLKKQMEEDKKKIQVNFKCDFCEKRFKFNFSLNKHLKTCKLSNTTLNKLECSICNVFIDQANYDDHVKTHENNSTEKKTDFTLNLKLCKLNGVWKSEQNVVYKCNICFQKFHTESNLVDHKKLHKKHDVQMQCDDCLMFVSDSEYYDHMQKIHNKYAFQCLECDLKFDKKQNLDCHLLHCTKSSRNIWKKFQSIKPDITLTDDAQNLDCLNIKESKIICTDYENRNGMDQINAENSNESIVESVLSNLTEGECSQKLNKENSKYIKVAEKNSTDQIDSINSNQIIVENVPHNLTMYDRGIIIKKEKGLCSNVIENYNSDQVNTTDSNEVIVEPEPHNQMIYDCNINIKKEKDNCTNIIESNNSCQVNATNSNENVIKTEPHNLMIDNFNINIKQEKDLCTNVIENNNSDQVDATNSNRNVIKTEPHNLIIDNFNINIKQEKDGYTDAIESNNSVNTTVINEFTIEPESHNLMLYDCDINIKREKDICINLPNQINTMNSELYKETASTSGTTNNYSQNINKRKILHTKEPTNLVDENIVCVENAFFSIRKLPNIENASSIVNCAQVLQNNVIFICNICKISPSTDIHSFALHMSDHRECNLHECVVCNKKFENVVLWTNHMAYHQEQIDLICPRYQNGSKKINFKIFTDNNLESIEPPQVPIMTLRNRENGTSSKNYNEIENSSTDQMHDINNSSKKSKNHCKICNILFPSKLTLIAHHKTLHNNQIQSYSSNYYDKNDSLENIRPNHENSLKQNYTHNTKSKIPIETQCNVNIVSNVNSNLIESVKMKHKKSILKMDENIPKPTNLNNDHINSEKYINKYKKTKRTEKEIYKNQVSLGKNLNTIDKKKLFCFICKKHFGHRGALSNHMRIHNTQHKCRYCEKVFNLKKDCISHEKSHGYKTKIKNVNNFNFNELKIEVDVDNQQKENCNNSLLVNKTINLKSFICSLCNKRFAHQGALSNHMRSHNDLRHKCRYCENVFNLKRACISHEKSHRYNKEIKNVNNLNFTETNNEDNADKQQRENCLPSVSGEFSNSFINTNLNTLVDETIDDKSFVCSICNKKFLRNISLSNHMRSHVNLQYKCQYCDKTFMTKRASISHRKKIHRFKQKVQHINNLNFNEDDQQIENLDNLMFVNDELIDGQNDDHSSKKNHTRFVCDVCKTKFSTPYPLIKHRNLHSDVKPYVCKICNKSYVVKYEWNRHLKNHYTRNKIQNTKTNKMLSHSKLEATNSTRPRGPIKCGYCKKEYHLLYHWKKHLSLSKECRRHCNNIPPELRLLQAKENNTRSLKFECHICKKTYSNLYNRKVHIQAVHKKITNTNINKDIGNKELTTIENIQQMPSVSNQRQCQIPKTSRYTCNICGKTYSNSANLTRHHSTIHVTQNKRVKCPICRRTFKHKYTYQTHMLMKHKQLLQNNGKINRNRKNRNNNINLPYNCLFCEMQFSDVMSFQRHSQIHTTDNYPCKDCGQMFETNFTLGNHILESHNIDETLDNMNKL